VIVDQLLETAEGFPQKVSNLLQATRIPIRQLDVLDHSPPIVLEDGGALPASARGGFLAQIISANLSQR
jgi:hypothetical protein